MLRLLLPLLFLTTAAYSFQALAQEEEKKDEAAEGTSEGDEAGGTVPNLREVRYNDPEKGFWIFVPDTWEDKRNYRGAALYLQPVKKERATYEKQVVAERVLSVQALSGPIYIDKQELEVQAERIRSEFEEKNPGTGAYIVSKDILSGEYSMGDNKHPVMRFRMSYNLRDKEVFAEILMTSTANVHFIVTYQDYNADFENNLDELYTSILSLNPVDTSHPPVRKTLQEQLAPWIAGAGGLLLFVMVISIFRRLRQRRVIRKIANTGDAYDDIEDAGYGDDAATGAGAGYDDEFDEAPRKKGRKARAMKKRAPAKKKRGRPPVEDEFDEDDDYEDEEAPPPRSRRRKPAREVYDEDPEEDSFVPQPPPRKQPRKPDPVLEDDFDEDPEDSFVPQPPPRKQPRKPDPVLEDDFDEDPEDSFVPPPKSKRKKAPRPPVEDDIYEDDLQDAPEDDFDPAPPPRRSKPPKRRQAANSRHGDGEATSHRKKKKVEDDDDFATSFPDFDD